MSSSTPLSQVSSVFSWMPNSVRLTVPSDPDWNDSTITLYLPGCRLGMAKLQPNGSTLGSAQLKSWASQVSSGCNCSDSWNTCEPVSVHWKPSAIGWVSVRRTTSALPLPLAQVAL